MSAANKSFEQRVEQIVKEDGNLAHMQPVIAKELLHYDILYALDTEGLLDQLTFQGGTSLRLCRQSRRYSEDLDFAGGREFQADNLYRMKECLIESISDRYQVDVRVKEPSVIRQSGKGIERGDHVKIDTWQISVETAPQKKDIPRQRIKIEVANIPAYTREVMPLHLNYGFLPQSYRSLLIYTESLNEIMADKLISFPVTQKYIRHRDIWDLVWLQQNGAELSLPLVQNKIKDYHIADYESLLMRRIEQVPQIVRSDSFANEMHRFLPADVYARTLQNEKFINYLTTALTSLLLDAKKGLDTILQIDDAFDPDARSGTSFRL